MKLKFDKFCLVEFGKYKQFLENNFRLFLIPIPSNEIYLFLNKKDTINIGWKCKKKTELGILLRIFSTK